MVSQSPAKPGPYRLLTEDVVNVLVIGFPELSVQTPVLPDGTITVPLLENVIAAGRTTSELARELETRWNKLVVNPKVTISIVSRKKRFVIVSGLVAKPGQVEYRFGMRTLEALASAGGFLPLADSSRVELVHGDGSHTSLDLSEPLKMAGKDPVLLPDDTLIVTEATRINVVGQVQNPGPVVYRPNMTVLDALQGAGGIKEDSDLDHALIKRGYVSVPVNLYALLRNGEMEQNVQLQPGDSVYIPERRNRVYVFGAVNKPGFYFVRPNDKLLDVLEQAGGMTPEADAKMVRYIQVGKNKDIANKFIVDLDQLFQKGDSTKNIPVQPGDVIYVSFRRKPVSWGDLNNILGTLNILFFNARILR
jgi:polysaccharide export outer membrane protein